MAVKTFSDFSGGYADNLNREIVPDNTLSKAEGVYWDAGLKKRKGKRLLLDATSIDANAIVRGCIYNALPKSGASGAIVAVEDATNIKFYTYIVTTWTQIGTKTFTKDVTLQEVIFAYVGNYIIACDSWGINKPVGIWLSGGTYYINDLEQIDARTRDNADWKAGQYVASGPTYTDDTTDAQDTGANDFAFSTVTNDDGFWIACFYTFTKVVMTDSHQLTGSPVAVYEYYKGAGVWGSLTLTTTPVWTAAAGDKTIEFDIPLDWVVYDVDAETNLVNRYVIRVRFTTATSADTCGALAISFTRSVSLALQNNNPRYLISHGQRCWMAREEIVAYSGYNSVTGWEPYYVEYFPAINGINGLASYQNSLIVSTMGALWQYSGTSFDNYIKAKITDIGATSNTMAECGGKLLFSHNNDLMVWDGARAYKIGKHINVVPNNGVSLDGRYYFTNTTSTAAAKPAKICSLDPDSVKLNDSGDGVASIYDTGISIELIDSGTLAGKETIKYLRYSSTLEYVVLLATKYVYTITENRFVDIDSTAIATDILTKYIDINNFNARKLFNRVKFSALNACQYTLYLVDEVGTTVGTKVFAHSYTPKQVAGTTYIADGGFEVGNLATNWGTAVTTTTGTALEATTKRTGGYSMKIAPTGGTCGRASALTSASKNKTLWLEGYYNITAYTAGKLNVDITLDGTVFVTILSVSAASTGWVKYSAAFHYPPDQTAMLRVYCDTTPTMTAYIDDITIEEITEYKTFEASVPYTIDGESVAIGITSSSITDMNIRSIALEYSPRRF